MPFTARWLRAVTLRPARPYKPITCQGMIPLTMARIGQSGTVLLLAAGAILALAGVTGIFSLSSLPNERGTAGSGMLPETSAGSRTSADHLPLPAPATTGTVSVEEALFGRRSARDYSAEPPDLSEISRLVWAAQGVTGTLGFRTAPSAGALYPLEVYVAAGNITGLPAGIYHYLPDTHALEKTGDRDVREELCRNALDQEPVRNAPAVIIIAADYNRTTVKYGTRGIRYVHMEAGHAAQNICLQAYALGIGTVPVGAFDDGGVRSVLGLPPEQVPLYLMPVGNLPVQGGV